MLLVRENLEIELKGSILSQIDDSLRLENDSTVSDEVKVHELRKAVKRSRALLRLLKHALDLNVYAELDELMGVSAKKLADQREATVNLRTFLNLTNTTKHPIPRELKAKILDGLSKKINHSYYLAPSNFSEQLEGSLHLLRQVRSKIETTPLQTIHAQNIATIINKTYNAASKLYNDSRYSLDTEIIHKWRKFNKHLLFQLKLSPLRPGNRTSKVISILENLSDTLGEEHDLAIMEDYLVTNFELSEDDLKRLRICVSKERSRLQKKAFNLGSKIYR